MQLYRHCVGERVRCHRVDSVPVGLLMGVLVLPASALHALLELDRWLGTRHLEKRRAEFLVDGHDERLNLHIEIFSQIRNQLIHLQLRGIRPKWRNGLRCIF